MARVFFALGGALGTSGDTESGEGLGVLRTHRGQARHGATNGEHLLHERRAVGHHATPGGQAADAMFEASFTGADAVGRGFCQASELG